MRGRGRILSGTLPVVIAREKRAIQYSRDASD